MIVLLRHLPNRANLSKDEHDAIEAFEEMAKDVARIKVSHKLKALRP
jgi:hypothetical protein